MDQYENNFRVDGFDNLDFLVRFIRSTACSEYSGVDRDQGLGQYENNFRVNGFDNLDFLVSFLGVQGVGEVTSMFKV